MRQEETGITIRRDTRTGLAQLVDRDRQSAADNADAHIRRCRAHHGDRVVVAALIQCPRHTILGCHNMIVVTNLVCRKQIRIAGLGQIDGITQAILKHINRVARSALRGIDQIERSSLVDSRLIRATRLNHKRLVGLPKLIHTVRGVGYTLREEPE